MNSQSEPTLAPFIDAAIAVISAHADELTALDQAIGDGDHGINMQRGFTAIAAIRPELEALAAGPALQKMGMTLVMKVGGASGPLYGSFLMAMGKALPAEAGLADLRLADVAQALAAGIEAVKQRGKSDVGAKTMLDVLVPVSAALQQGLAEQLAGSALVQRIRVTAEQSLQATGPMLATKGRASFLGERSIGHIDPGARSSFLLIDAVCHCCVPNYSQQGDA